MYPLNSGGQKQRISVARVAYSRKEVVILDDPLSALDPEVAGKMFKECIAGFLKDRTRLLVTNQLNFLPKCDSVLVLQADDGEPGRIVEQGRYSRLIASGLNFSRLMQEFSGNGDSQAGSDGSGSQGGDDGDGDDDDAQGDEEDEAEDEEWVVRAASEMSRRQSSGGDGALAMQAEDGKALMQVEERQKGAVQLGEYMGYLRAGGGYCFFLVVLALFGISQAGNLLNAAWVTLWTDDADYERASLTFYLVGYGLTAVALALVTYIRSVAIFYLGLRASRKLHNDLLDSVTHAPMSFFDTTPIGRVVSRFSKDIFLIDTLLPMMFSFFLFTTTFVLLSMATIAFVTPLFLPVIAVVGVLYFYIVNYYRPLMRDTKRLESISRSPIYAHFSETLGGLSTIRAFNFAPRFSSINSTKVDENLRSWYVAKAIERWLAIRLELIGAAVTITASCLAVLAADRGTISAGLAGLSLSFAISITALLNQTLRSFVELESSMNSVERVLHYTDNIDQEAPFDSMLPPPPDWPAEGRVVISDLRMRYRPDTPLVLKGISIDIAAGERIGVVGRTGAGKSSVLLALLRLVEPEMGDDGDGSGEGPITIDGIDISRIGLHELRSKVSIVPQNPVIFSGTVRSNLDPFGKYTDDEMWSALERCYLKDTVADLGGLAAPISEYGDNLSQGQRQLLCFSRSVLAQARILLLDEATSSIDFETDAAIQRTVREAFADCTVITIAHRLQTIIDSSKVLVLDAGEVAEYDSPGNLLNDGASAFSSMVAELGQETAAKLKAQATR